jgi:hypothetical protein
VRKKKTSYAGKSQTQKREGILSRSEGEMQVKKNSKHRSRRPQEFGKSQVNQACKTRIKRAQGYINESHSNQMPKLDQ